MKIIVRVNQGEVETIRNATNVDLIRAIHEVKVVTGVSKVVGRITVIDGEKKVVRTYRDGKAIEAKKEE